MTWSSVRVIVSENITQQTEAKLIPLSKIQKKSKIFIKKIKFEVRKVLNKFTIAIAQLYHHYKKQQHP